MRKDVWGREHFAWLPEEDAYICPGGQKLRRSRAGASVDSLTRRDDLVQPPTSVTECLYRLDEENDRPAEEETPLDAGASAADPGSSRPLRPNQELVSRTDPEATLVNRPDFGRHLAYKAHLAVAGRCGQVITSAVATTGIAADEHLLPEVLWQHRRLSRLGVLAVVADAKYGTTANYLYLGQLGIPTFVPCQLDRQWPGSIPGAEGQLPVLSLAGTLRALRQRNNLPPLLGSGVCRSCGGTIGQPIGQATGGGKEDLRRGCVRTGQRVAWAEADAIQRQTPGPNPALADSSGDEHQEGGEERKTEPPPP